MMISIPITSCRTDQKPSKRPLPNLNRTVSVNAMFFIRKYVVRIIYVDKRRESAKTKQFVHTRNKIAIIILAANAASTPVIAAQRAYIKPPLVHSHIIMIDALCQSSPDLFLPTTFSSVTPRHLLFNGWLSRTSDNV